MGSNNHNLQTAVWKNMSVMIPATEKMEYQPQTASKGGPSLLDITRRFLKAVYDRPAAAWCQYVHAKTRGNRKALLL